MALQLSALRFALRTSSPRMIFGPWENKELHDKYTKLGYKDAHLGADGSHDYQYKYMAVDVGPSLAPWHKFPTAAKPHPYGEYSQPFHNEMYPRHDATFVGYWQAWWNIQRDTQSRSGRLMANIGVLALVYLAITFASLGANGEHEDHSRDWVIDLPRRF